MRLREWRSACGSGGPRNGEEESCVIHPSEGRVRKPDERWTCVRNWEGCRSRTQSIRTMVDSSLPFVYYLNMYMIREEHSHAENCG